MNKTNLPTNAALLRLRAAIPTGAVFMELSQAIHSSGLETAFYRATIVIGDDSGFGESDSAEDAADKAIADHAANNAKAKKIAAARATLEAEGYIVSEEDELNCTEKP
jgi:hypothetical protein